MISYLLIISILAGQLIKFPVFGIQGPTLLDFSVLIFLVVGLIKLKLRLHKPAALLKIGYLFSLVGIISLALTPLHLSLTQYLISLSYALRFFLYILFGHVLYSGAFEGLRKKIPQVLLYSGVGLAVLGFLQLLIFPNLQFLQSLGWDPHYFRTVSTFLDPNFTGAYFILTLILLPPKFQFALIYLALLTTFSRSSYLMFLISGISLAYYKKSKKILLGTLVLFSGLLLGFQIYSQTVATPRGIDREQSASYRLTTWQQGLTIFQESPILGVGFNAYKFGVREYHLSDDRFFQSRGSTTNDFSLLYVLATTGVVGLFVYLIFLFHLPRVAVLGLLIHSIFANSLFYPPIILMLILLSIKKESI